MNYRLSLALIALGMVCSGLSHVHNDPHPCLHDQIQNNHEPAVAHHLDYMPVKADRARQFRTQAFKRGGHQDQDDDTEPLRIHINTDHLDTDGKQCHEVGQRVERLDGFLHICKEEDILTDFKREYLTKVLLPTAGRWFEESIRVRYRPEGGAVTLAAGDCFDIKIPHKFTQLSDSPVVADLVIFATARPSSEVTAWSTYCQEASHGQPIAGILNVSPRQLKTGAAERRQLLGEVRHQMTHILGFSYNKFADFRADFDVSYKKPLYMTLGHHNHADHPDHKITSVISDRVKQVVREHFGCDDLEGAELETQSYDEDGGAGSHWESRLFMDEFMTELGPDTLANPRFTKLTMALLEDSGWYKADYSKADPMVWGKNQGCDFVRKSCAEWKQPGTFCQKEEEEGCGYDFRAKGMCNYGINREDIPKWARYFHHERKGGLLPQADFCPFYYSRGEDYCDIKENGQNVAPIFGEKYGQESRCFMSSVLDTKFSLSHSPFPEHRPRCYPHRCTGSRLEVLVGNKWMACPEDGGEVHYNVEDGYAGTIKCPKRAHLCDGTQSLGLLSVSREADEMLAHVVRSDRSHTLAFVADNLPALGMVLGVVAGLLLFVGAVKVYTRRVPSKDALLDGTTVSVSL